MPPLIALLIVGLLLAFVAWGRIHRRSRRGARSQWQGVSATCSSRVLQGNVTDFLVVKPLPVFNVADIFILAGFLLMIGASLIADLAEPATQAHVKATRHAFARTLCPRPSDARAEAGSRHPTTTCER